MKKMESWFGYSLIALLLWGLWGFFPKLTTSYVNPQSALVYEVLGAVIVGVLVFISIGFRLETDSKGIIFGVITGMAGLGGALAFLFAISKGKASVVVTLTALYPLVAVLLSCLILHEPITVKQGIGIVLAVIAMILFAG